MTENFRIVVGLINSLVDQADNYPEIFRDQTISTIRVTRQRKGKDGRIYLLSGALKDCDGNLFQGNSSNSGRNLYYYNRVSKIRLNREEIEDLVCKRVKKYLCEDGRLSSVIQSVLKNSTVNLGKFSSEILKVKRNIENQKIIIEKFSETLRQAALDRFHLKCTTQFHQDVPGNFM